MGKTILAAKQFEFLEFVSQNSQITNRFYLTGGTALAEFYLKHRLSEDIDLFIEDKEVEPMLVESFLQKASKELGVKKIKRSQFMGLMSYLLIYDDGDQLKVDFNYYPFPRIEMGKKYHDLEIDSLRDIAVNKLHTLFMKPRDRDYVDLYFILMEKNYNFDRLILDAKAKFDWHIDRVNLANQLIKVVGYQDSPRILKSFKRQDMERFFLKKARDLKKMIFK